MSKPSNPFEIILTNVFFKKGLTESDIYNYWMKNKNNLLTTIRSDNVVFYLANNKNSSIVIRYDKQTKTPFKLNSENYEKIISGRVIGILRSIKDHEKYAIIDIDSPNINNVASDEPSDLTTFNLVKNVAKETFDYFNRLYKCKIYYTGKNGFHIYCEIPGVNKINLMRDILIKQIKTSPLLKIASFEKKRNNLIPNLDLSLNYPNKCVIIPGSLNKIGLPCVEVQRNEIDNFNRNNLIREVKND